MQGCSRGFQAARAAYAPDRLLKPLVRTGPRGSGEFKAVSWPEALDRVAEKLIEIKNKYGSESLILLGGSGACRGALHNTGLLAKRFLNLFGGYTQVYGNYSSAAVNFVTPYVFGTPYAGIDPGTLQHARLILLWGANIAVTRFGSEFPPRIREAAKRGVPLIVIDPRKSKTAGMPNAQWVQIRPGTDTALMAAVLYELIHRNQVDRSFVERYCIGFDSVESYILGTDDHLPKTPAWAEKICGTPADTIQWLADTYGRTKPTALIPGLSIQRTIGGEEAARMAMVLQAATGNTGIPGGTSGGCVWGRLPQPRCGRMDSLSRPGHPAISEYLWPDAILEGKKGGFPTEIRAIYNVGGNYLSQGSDIRKNIRAFESVDFSVCHEQFMTPTARYCDVVLPVTTFLEREDIIFTTTNYLLYSGKAIKAPNRVKNDYDIFCELAKRLGFPDKFSEGKTAGRWLEEFIAASAIKDVDAFKQTGIYAGEDQMRVGLSDFIADPAKNALKTPSGKIELASESYARTGFPAIPTYRGMSDDDKHPLRLVTPHSFYRINSTYSNVAWFRDKERQVLWINPVDAAKRDIRDEQIVLVRNTRGKMRISVKVTKNIMPGVVCLREGIWPELDADGCDRAGSTNMLTSTVPTKPSEGSRTHSVLVEVESENQ
jgi:anaerobic dimethyl sulfoxide reductase subunit A